MNEIIRILMDRDDMEYEEACDELALMREALEDKIRRKFSMNTPLNRTM